MSGSVGGVRRGRNRGRVFNHGKDDRDGWCRACVEAGHPAKENKAAVAKRKLACACACACTGKERAEGSGMVHGHPERRWDARRRDPRVNGADLYVVRVSKAGVGAAKPCWRCVQ